MRVTEEDIQDCEDFGKLLAQRAYTHIEWLRVINSGFDFILSRPTLLLEMVLDESLRRDISTAQIMNEISSLRGN
jgi:hypothetical protein